MTEHQIIWAKTSVLLHGLSYSQHQPRQALLPVNVQFFTKSMQQRLRGLMESLQSTLSLPYLSPANLPPLTSTGQNLSLCKRHCQNVNKRHINPETRERTRGVPHSFTHTCPCQPHPVIHKIQTEREPRQFSRNNHKLTRFPKSNLTIQLCNKTTNSH